MARLPPKSAPLLVQEAFRDRRHRLSIHRHSISHMSICFVLFHTYLVLISQSIYMYLVLCFPSCLCVIVYCNVVWSGALLLLYSVVLALVCFYVLACWNGIKVCLFATLCSLAPDFASATHALC